MNDLDTLRPEVREAVFEIDAYPFECRHNVRGWKTVRAELLRLTQENADLRSSIELNEQVWIQRNETMHKWIERARKAESELAALKARIKPCARVVGGEVRVLMDSADEGKYVAVLVVEE